MESGTVAISKFDKNKLKPNLNFEKLSLMEEEHLLTKASIPYRDENFNSNKDEIIKQRLNGNIYQIDYLQRNGERSGA